MKIKENDAFVLNKTCFIGDEGDIFYVDSISDTGNVRLKKETENSVSKLVVPMDFIENYFTYIPEEEDDYAYFDEAAIEDAILDNCDIATTTAFNTCVIVAAKLPNGDVIVENYNLEEGEDEQAGVEICLEYICSQIRAMRNTAFTYDDIVDAILDKYDDCDSCSFADSCVDNFNYKAGI